MTQTFDHHPAGFGLVAPAEIAAMGGLAFLTAMMEGRVPGAPIARTARMRMVEVAEGRVVFEAEPSADFLNPLGTVHGGWTATVLDTVMACAVHSTLAPGEAYTTLEFKVHCARPVLPEAGLVRCEGLVISRARRAATSEGRLFDAKGRLLAHGTETCMIFAADQSARS